MPWEFDTTRPIYLQLVERIKGLIVTGQLAPGEKLSSVRDLAEEVGVNPNTMQRALAELEREGLLYSQRTSGRFVTEDEILLEGIRKEFAAGKISEFVQSLVQLGYKQEEVFDAIKHYMKEMG